VLTHSTPHITPVDAGSPAAPHWYAIWTRSRHEPVVCRALAAKSVESFLPTISRISNWKDRRKRLEWPMFPGYCFARFDGADLLSVLNCDGVVTVLSTAGQLVPVSDHEIDALQRLVRCGLSYDVAQDIPIGRTVRVVEGPLRGVVGRLVRYGQHEQLILAVEILGSGARVQVAADDVEPV
jgi:transcription antitermination factor NusG